MAVAAPRETDASGALDGSIIGRIGALLAGAGRSLGRFDLQDGAGAIHVTLTQGVDVVRFEGASQYRGLAGQFSGAIRPTAALGVSQYVLEYSDPECCGCSLSFTVKDSTGGVLSVVPPEIDRRDKVALLLPADTEARQKADDAKYLEQGQVGP
ncbi:hypothetical protein [Lichenicoccus sp.]|uniref:hypothetical protein n=1 Tax=Lichenicoccus sp. TaxID=2781899 RepID=UPI003D10BCBB